MPIIEISFPFPYRINPHLEAARPYHLDWMKRMGLQSSPQAVKWHADYMPLEAVALSYPQADIGATDLALIADGWVVLAALDDLAVRCAKTKSGMKEFGDRYTAMMADPEARIADPLAQAWRDVWYRQTLHTTTTWQECALSRWRETIASYIEEASNVTNFRHPTIEQYLTMRYRSMATPVMIDLAESAGRFEVPLHATGDPLIRRLLHLCASVLIHNNDATSVEKEYADGEPNNLIFLLEIEQGYSRGEAIEEVRSRIHHMLTEFQKAAQKVPALCDSLGLTSVQKNALCRRIDIMCSLMRGTSDWAHITRRY